MFAVSGCSILFFYLTDQSFFPHLGVVVTLIQLNKLLMHYFLVGVSFSVRRV